MSGTLIRQILFDEIEKEIIGPHEKNETFVNTEHPKSKYLSGVLYPIQTPVSGEDIDDKPTQIPSNEDNDVNEKTPLNVGTKPSSMGMSCTVPIEQNKVTVTITYGRYIHVDSQSKNKSDLGETKNKESENDTSTKTKEYPDWTRIDHEEGPFDIELTKSEGRKELEPNVFFRFFTHKNKKEKTITLNVFITNEAQIKGDEFIEDHKCVFQPKIKLTSPDKKKVFLNISKPTDEKIKKSNPREQITLFLFRNFKHFAQGRNCSVEWNLEETEDKTDWVRTTFIPHYFVPEIKPRETSGDVKKSLNMKYLSTITNFKDYENILKPILDGYKTWINNLDSKRIEWEKLDSDVSFEKKFISDTANVPKELTNDCKDTLSRIENGIKIISSDPLIGESFRFANEVMYENIAHSKWAKKNKEILSRGETINEDGPDSSIQPEWRLFQLAYLLLVVESITNPNSDDREISDLLWFPTGGGKTEAYYGVIAFTLAYRRIKGKDKKSIEEQLDRYGVSIIMRYTYRLLTLQQFQRAVTLFCACEYVRMKNPQNIEKFGSYPFLVGLWVGHDTTPNSFGEAKRLIQQKRANPGLLLEKTDPIQLLNCPWCGRSLDAFNYEYENSQVHPEKLTPKRIQIRCNNKCFFGKKGDPERVLPVVFVDEDIRNLCPSLLISTVDKFAQISWNWKYSTFFGVVSQCCKEHGYRPGNAPTTSTADVCRHSDSRKLQNGRSQKILVNVGRKLAPPELIIQDELHLIAGPLGTLTGLYETAIDVLCTDERTGIKPKIIASTATTKKSDIQMKHLFNSKSSKIFPPQGFEFGESYFAEVLDVDDEHPGKLHVGVCSTSVSGYNVDSRIAACILRKIRHIHENKDNYYFKDRYEKFTDNELNPYYTLVSYYNTIKSLGAAIRMYEDTIPSYMGVIIETSENKFDTKNNATKNYVDVLQKNELTGRINAAKIPSILQNIETNLGDKDVLDALLCTNMLSVGVDVDRLSAMVINGQPKSTSEYIQATGRIGRKYPGIVVTNYTYIRPRDLSYFENFIEFHSTFHKYVEPGTLTPFSSRARDRGLSGIFFALIRTYSKTLSVDPMAFDAQNPLIETIKQQILDRVEEIDPPEYNGTKDDLNNLIKKWNIAKSQCSSWTESGRGILKYRKNPYTNRTEPDVVYLLNSSRDAYDEHTFVIPESLREAESEISLYYHKHYGDETDG